MFDRLAGDKTIYDYAQSAAYPIERVVDVADKAASRDPRFLGDLRKAMDDPHPVIRYWGALGCVILQDKSAPAKTKLGALLRDEWADVRIVAAEALGYHGEAEAALAALAPIVRSKQQYEVLAALNTLEYMWKAGHVRLARLQGIVRDLELAEPADRIPRYLLSVK
jgi:HEAT repeat protein